MFRVAICDDSKEFLAYEESLIEFYMHEHSIEYQCDKYLSGYDLIAEGSNVSKYNLFILDYDMEGLTGFDTASRIYELFPEAKIAFATNYYDFTREGYKYNAVRYLVKQEDSFKTDLFECIDAVMKKSMPKTILLDLYDRKEEVKLDDILYIQSNRHYSHYFIRESKSDNYIRP